jgi:serine phosphatase RsbU (regulator of sigma subunit)
LLVFLADVMGHDTASALVATALRPDLYRLRQAGVTSPAELLRQLDRAVTELFPPYFVTAACCLLDAGASSLTWSLAGHPPLLLRERSGRVCSLHRSAYPLGMMDGDAYPEQTTALPPGASLLLYSDGVSDLLGGPEGLAGVLADSAPTAQALVDGVRRAVEAFTRHDDCTVLAVRLR